MLVEIPKVIWWGFVKSLVEPLMAVDLTMLVVILNVGPTESTIFSHILTVETTYNGPEVVGDDRLNSVSHSSGESSWMKPII